MKLKKEFITFKVIVSQEETTTLLVKLLEHLGKNVPLEKIGKNTTILIGDYPIEASLAKLFKNPKYEGHGNHSIIIGVQAENEGKLHEHYQSFFIEMEIPAQEN